MESTVRSFAEMCSTRKALMSSKCKVQSLPQEYIGSLFICPLMPYVLHQELLIIQESCLCKVQSYELRYNIYTGVSYFVPFSHTNLTNSVFGGLNCDSKEEECNLGDLNSVFCSPTNFLCGLGLVCWSLCIPSPHL